MNNEYSTIGLYDHNAQSYKKVSEAFEQDDVVAIVHATGTGKSYNALQLAYDNKDKKIIYVVPSNGIIEHIQKIIDENPNLDLDKDFSHIEFRTYQSFISMDIEEIETLDVDMLILDEFHHIGAPVWGSRIDSIMDTHPDIKVFGMTAYTVRDRGTSYERDMADPDSNELFSNKVVSRYDLCDAMIDGVLPKPIYKSAYINLIGTERQLEEKVLSLDASSSEKELYLSILNDVKKRLSEAPGIAEVMHKNIKPNGKYIYFCPPASEEGVNDIETIKEEARNWFTSMGLSDDDIVFYETTSEMGKKGKDNREAFYGDIDLNGESVDNKLRVMFAINQYNEGIHAPNIDGVIMGRGTTSDIVYFEQLGRALSVRGSSKEKYEEYETYSIEQLLEECKKRDISVKDNVSKEDIIEYLIAPLVIDLANNFDFIKELENNLKDRIKLIQNSGLGIKREIKIRDASFDIEIENQDLFEMLRYISDRLNNTWEKKYEYAKIYYEKHGNLEVLRSFKTNNGYEHDDNGIFKLGEWISIQRNNKSLSPERIELLSQIGMNFDNQFDVQWNKIYEYAKKYYEKHGNLEVPQKFKTNNGYKHDDNGTVKLGEWISVQRQNKSLSQERIELLSQIGMIFDSHFDYSWKKMYEYAKIYYDKHGNLEVPRKFKTNNGYEHDDNGEIKLGDWISRQRRSKTLSKERVGLLFQIGMRFEVKNNITWEEMYEYAKIYYDKHGNLEVPRKFKTNNGYEHDDNGKIKLGQWISKLRNNKTLALERVELLSQIGMSFDNQKDEHWNKMYEYAKKYYDKHGHLEVPADFKTNNGYEYDENGTVNLGRWIMTQRGNKSLSPERVELLSQIGMSFDNQKDEHWNKMYEYAKKYYEKHENLEVPRSFKTNNGYKHDDNGEMKLGEWISRQRSNKTLSKERVELLSQIGMNFDNQFDVQWNKMYEYAKKYYEKHENLEVPQKFKTNNGYKHDDNGEMKLGEWISRQRSNTTLSKERVELLSQIGMRFEVKNNITWEEMYEYSRKYYEKHGNLEVPKRFKTNNGYKHDDNGEIKLGEWVSWQRRSKTLSKERVELLSQIGMRFEVKNNITWEKKYEYAKIYYEKHGNLEVLRSFKTNNGYEHDDNGTVNLGEWISKQRRNETLSYDRVELLNQIGMIWDIKKNKCKIKEVCTKNNIDMKVNKKVLKNISIQELQSKLYFLQDNGMSIIDSDGKLHEIFSMSGMDMKEKYGVDLAQLIDKYYDLEKNKER